MGKPRNRTSGPRKKSQKKALLQRDGAICAWCKKLFHPDDLTIDHVRPISQGGRNALFNLALSCRPCNVEKADKPAHELARRRLDQYPVEDYGPGLERRG